jgi:hypothetical protein
VKSGATDLARSGARSGELLQTTLAAASNSSLSEYTRDKQQKQQNLVYSIFTQNNFSRNTPHTHSIGSQQPFAQQSITFPKVCWLLRVQVIWFSFPKSKPNSSTSFITGLNRPVIIFKHVFLGKSNAT